MVEPSRPGSAAADSEPASRPADSPSDLRFRVLHFLAPAAYGGLESVVVELAAGHAARGHDVTVVPVLTESGEGTELVGRLRGGAARLLPVRAPGRAYPREWREAAAICRRVRPDLIHTHGYRSDVLEGLLARRLGIPVVSTLHGFCRGGWKNRLYEALQRVVVRRNDAVVAVSGPLAEDLAASGVERSRLHVVPNAMSTAREDLLTREEARGALGIERDAYVAGWVGRIGPEKGLDVLLDALDRVPRPMALAVIGDGPDRRDLEERATGISGHDVSFLGAIPSAARLYRAFDLLVLSSRTEGTPMVLLEAMAAGVPVVATRVGGVPDVVTEREAWLVEPEASSDLADAIGAARGDPGEAARRGEAARDRLMREFAPEPWLRRYEEIYRSVSPTAKGRDG